jgi:hypothetical protein
LGSQGGIGHTLATKVAPGGKARASVVVVVAGDRAPQVPSDAQDHDRDRQADQGVGDVEAERDDDRARDDREADEPVNASVVSVGDERGTVEAGAGAQAHLGRDLVADEADDRRLQGAAVVDIRAEPVPKSGAGKVLKNPLRDPFWTGRERRVS